MCFAIFRILYRQSKHFLKGPCEMAEPSAMLFQTLAMLPGATAFNILLQSISLRKRNWFYNKENCIVQYVSERIFHISWWSTCIDGLSCHGAAKRELLVTQICCNRLWLSKEGLKTLPLSWLFLVQGFVMLESIYWTSYSSCLNFADSSSKHIVIVNLFK